MHTTPNLTQTNPYESHIDSSTSQTPQEREALAQNLQEENTISTRHLVYAFGIFFGILGLCFPKIYLSNTIYATSKEVFSLQTSKEILSEENKKLRRELEDIDFRFRVLDNAPQ
ncbi:hypothetical protein [Helicobacter sp. TUL]|uniref:hypothetical protein n=1 Tax=Helicobacter sp. TUL TaxID=1848928 RepID=UPI000BABA100|nr:hypothetical protein [Helicobacter sp. TUL]PAV00993.1 hypothetical protein B9T66_00975 [Helicobacter sp. TUL]